jgi:arylsulfatase A-like enzyme
MTSPALPRRLPWLSLFGTLGLGLLLAGPGRLAAAAGTPARPNLIFLLADDLRWDALGFAGNRQVQTPNLDRLAARGTRFNRHFVTTSICNVSRASMFSGQYLRRHGITNFNTPFTTNQWRETYPALLRAAGWQTGFIGKFGVGSNPAIQASSNLFDFWRGLPGQAGLFFERNDPTGAHKTARFGNHAVQFIRGCEPGQPFCLSLSFNAPHARDHEPREFWPDARDEGLYTNLTIPRPPKSDPSWFERLPSFVQESEGRRRWTWRFTNEMAFQRTVKDYYRLITGIDREVGRILSALEERGLATNTVLVFTSDNGFFLGERGLADKWFMYEESIRVPLLIADLREPAARGPRTVDAMTLNIDLAPTLLDLAGLPAPRAMQGRSLRPLLDGATPRDWRTEFFYEHHTKADIIPPSEGVRTERWKYLRWVTASPALEELYDLKADPGEERNLAADPAQAEALAGLRARWARYSQELR